MTDAIEPVFPIHPDGFPGLTKREYFAAMAMQGLLSNSNTARQIQHQHGDADIRKSNELVANTAVLLSDALIVALNKSDL